MGTANRINLLDKLLDYLSNQKNVKFILARDLARDLK